MAILDYQPDVWREALDMPQGTEPSALILEGTWWREVAVSTRLAHLENVRELAFPDMFLGTWNGATIAYCCAYGAARAVEPVHIFAQLGTPLMVQIGTCGTLDVAASSGMVVLPEECHARDGISQIYGAGAVVRTDPGWVARAEALLRGQQVETTRGQHLTWPSLFAQSDQICAGWMAEGLLSVDMETSAVVAVADHFGAAAVSLLSVWDALPHGRTFMDPLEPAEAAALKRSNEIVFDVALHLAREAGEIRLRSA
ncbi:MAG: hypothetical protein AAF245_01610 [Pseudomonadota bacterium]